MTPNGPKQLYSISLARWGGGGSPNQTWVKDSKWTQETLLMPNSKVGVFVAYSDSGLWLQMIVMTFLMPIWFGRWLTTQTRVNDSKSLHTMFLMPFRKGGGLSTQIWDNDFKWSQTTFLIPISKGEICQPRLGSMTANGPKLYFQAL